MGRFAHFVRQANPNALDDEIMKRVLLGHAMMFFSRGSPTIYYGDEQGFAGDGGDQDARETLFASKVAVYNDNKLVGTTATTATDNFNPDHPIYRALANMARIRAADPALRRGDQVVRAYGDNPGLFALSRLAPSGGGETLVAFNTGATPVTANVQVDAGSMNWQALHGRCAPRSGAPGSVRVEIAPFDYIVCKAAAR
jgi:glycosidase